MAKRTSTFSGRKKELQSEVEKAIQEVQEQPKNKGGRSKKYDEPTTRMNADIPVSLYTKFKSIIDGRGQSITFVVTKFVEEFVEENEE